MAPPEQLAEVVVPSGDLLLLNLACSSRAGPWNEPDHHYTAACACGCEYTVRAHGRGEGLDWVCPAHRGQIRYLDSEEIRDILPYGNSSEEYLRERLRDGARMAFVAFLEGRNWRPATFEYGTNAGDYRSPLESRGNELWYHLVRQSRATKSVLIAVKEVA